MESVFGYLSDVYMFYFDVLIELVFYAACLIFYLYDTQPKFVHSMKWFIQYNLNIKFLIKIRHPN